MTYEPNSVYKISKTIKTLVYPTTKNNEILLRIANYEDRFDLDAAVQHFDVNAWARDFYLEANAHLVNSAKSAYEILATMQVNITEMNLAGIKSLADV